MDTEATGGLALALVVVCLVLGAYLFPGIVGYWRRHRQREAILVLTILLGWTGLGWCLALVWAFTNDRARG